tara:strand:- start:140 stop:457 length:318 start_codon:yes stop_codon:yes gene_type:complete
MTSNDALTVKDRELASLGLVESAGVNSFADFIPSKLNPMQIDSQKNENDFKNLFICHLIFYCVFCISLLLYILIDLGLGSFIKNKFFQLVGLGNKTFFEKSPVYA